MIPKIYHNQVKQLILFCVTLFFLTSPSFVWAANIYTRDKLITVDTSRQLLTAWDQGKVIYQSKVSTGLPLSPTVKGSFRIYYKTPSDEMIGYSPYKGNYDLKNVPYTMYFYQGYSIHGAYWHNNFGRPASNGCVNEPVAFSKTLYEWAPLGTRVEVF